MTVDVDGTLVFSFSRGDAVAGREAGAGCGRGDQGPESACERGVICVADVDMGV
jgi:hypothetical protein